MFTFKQFSVDDSLTAMKVGTDGVLLGAWAVGGKRILDVGTGSGLIALMMAQRFPSARISGIDIDDGACRQARQNADASPFKDCIEIVNKPLQEFAEIMPEGSFDCIVSNPPYFQNSLKSPDSRRTVARHNDSLPFRELISCSMKLLSDGGVLSIIGPADSQNDIESEAIIHGMTVSKVILIKTGIKKKPSRFMIQLRKGFSTGYSSSVEILTETGGVRSEWYHELTKDFYIK